ncbi:MAG: hypothetical protein AB7P04_09110 [Bacteriovoracia bacterium]
MEREKFEPIDLTDLTEDVRSDDRELEDGDYMRTREVPRIGGRSTFHGNGSDYSLNDFEEERETSRANDRHGYDNYDDDYGYDRIAHHEGEYESPRGSPLPSPLAPAVKPRGRRHHLVKRVRRRASKKHKHA